MVGAFRPVICRHYCLGVRPGIRSVVVSLVMSMYLAYRIQYSNPTLLALSISCFCPYLPVSASEGPSHHCVLSFPNQNPHLSSICGETVEVEGNESTMNTLPHLSWHSRRNSGETAGLARAA